MYSGFSERIGGINKYEYFSKNILNNVGEICFLNFETLLFTIARNLYCKLKEIIYFCLY